MIYIYIERESEINANVNIKHQIPTHSQRERERGYIQIDIQDEIHAAIFRSKEFIDRRCNRSKPLIA